MPFGAGAAEAPELTASESSAFIILPKEFPANVDITWPVGRYVVPTNAALETTTYGNLVHEQIGKLVQDALPDVDVILTTSPPSMRDVDIEFSERGMRMFGFRYAEIKPATGYGFRSYNSQIARWKKPVPVLAITYDYDGNIYYGFPW